ncbi:MAG: hypothetical protein GQ548_06530 [Methylophaga sp.]|nr:hypothetical protein [Methylophaga sp.]
MLQDLIASLEGNITQLEPYEFWIAIAIISTIAVIAFLRMIRWWNHSRMIEDVPTSKIRSASQGYVELVGHARMMEGPIVISPLTGKTCVWYRYKIEEKIKSYDAKGRSRTYWHVVKQETSEELFLLEDETGRCVIDPDDADVIATNKRTWHKRLVIPPRRYTEELIVDNEPLYGIGLFKTIANVEHQQQRQQVNHLLREWKNDPNQLLHDYDADRDNHLSQEEWEKARLAAERQVKRKHGQLEKLEQLNILKNSPHKNQGFILSTIPEHKLIKQYKFKALLAMLIFFTSGSLTVWAINIRLGI